jgi:hypothetical protein
MIAGGYLTLAESLSKMSRLTWTKDGLTELYDSVGSPGWVQYVLNRVEQGYLQPNGSLDCDDFSSWAAYVLQERYNPVIFVFSWARNKELMGHAMCWCEHPDGGYVHIGNWGLSNKYDSLRPACEDILSRYSNMNSKAEPIGWALLTQNLWPTLWGVGLPSNEVTNGC